MYISEADELTHQGWGPQSFLTNQTILDCVRAYLTQVVKDNFPSHNESHEDYEAYPEDGAVEIDIAIVSLTYKGGAHYVLSLTSEIEKWGAEGPVRGRSPRR